MTKGFVYILTNEFMPGLVKVGMTTRTVESRILELCQTGVPGKFQAASFVFSPDCRELEATVHEDLMDHRVDAGREFFRCPPREAELILNHRLEEQVSLLVDEFLDGQVLVSETHFVDPSFLYLIGSVIGVPEHDVPNILGEVRASDESIDMNVLRERWESRKRRMSDERKARLLVVEASEDSE